MAISDLFRETGDAINAKKDRLLEKWGEWWNDPNSKMETQKPPEELRYPETSMDDYTPYVLFSHHKAFYDNTAANGSYGRTTTGRVAMYMPMAIQMADSFAYENVSTGLAGSIYQYVKKNGVELGDGGVTSETVMAYATQNASAVAAGIGGVAGKVIGKEIGAVVGGVVGMKAAGDVAHEFSKSAGVTVNPRQFILFQSPNLRQFNMEFRFIPNNAKESDTVIQIIQQFREYAYPTYGDGIQATFVHPDSWSIHFGNVNGMIQIPEVVITGINITYNPNSASFFTDNQRPVEIVMSLAFSELQPITRKDVRSGY